MSHLSDPQKNTSTYAVSPRETTRGPQYTDQSVHRSIKTHLLHATNVSYENRQTQTTNIKPRANFVASNLAQFSG